MGAGMLLIVAFFIVVFVGVVFIAVVITVHHIELLVFVSLVVS